MAKPIALFDPHPRPPHLIFTPQMMQRLKSVVMLAGDGDGPMSDAEIDLQLGQASLVIGQTALPRERLERAPHLRAIINVEGNFLPNVDYEACFERGIQVLAVAPVFALPVAELALGMALDLARGITAGDRAFRHGQEAFGLSGNRRARILTGTSIGMIGFGNLGRALLPLLQPFRPTIRVFDPWLPPGYLIDFGVLPATLDEVMSQSETIFILAGVTSENQAMIGKRELALVPDGGAVILMSRAGVVDWDDFLAAASSGRISLASDVFPVEPVSADDPVRENHGILLSAHRGGAMSHVFNRIGEMVVDDTQMIVAGLPPVRLQAARRETVGRLRSPPGKGRA